MMKMAAEMMSSMNPEEIENMMKMQATMQPSQPSGRASVETNEVADTIEPSGMGNIGNMSPEMMAQMEKQMSDPQNMEAMSNMMKNMSPETLMTMSKQMGKEMTEEEAEK